MVALCCVTVLGLGLASYLSLSNQAIKLSNRSHAGGVSGQLAETGLEEALRSLNKNDWNGWSNGGASATWSDVDATTKKGTITFPTGKFGPNITGSVNVLVQNYNAAQLNAVPWNGLTSYQLNDLVSDNGVWYRSVCDGNLNKSTSKLGWWVPAPIPWAWSPDISYSKGDFVNHRGIWFRCSATTDAMPRVPSPPVSPYPQVPALPKDWIDDIDYALHDVVDIAGTLYTCIEAYHSSSPFLAERDTYWASIANKWKPVIDVLPWISGTYSPRVVVSYNGKIYRCTTATSGNPEDNPADWTFDLPAISLSWSSATEYSPGALVFDSGIWYSCSTPHESSDPDLLSSGMWDALTSPTEIAWNWKASVPYNFNDVVYYGTPAAWYRCKVPAPSGATPSASSSYWENALSGGAHGWSTAGINYNLGDTVYYDITAQWYRCIQAHASGAALTPSNTVYWSNLPLHSTRWNAARTYSVNDTASYNGISYLCLSSGSNRIPPTISPFFDSSWAGTTDITRQWNPTTVYTSGAYCSYGGVWYKCLAGTAGRQSPNDSAFWSPSWQASSGVNEGTPVIYAEGTSHLTDGASTKTLLRATVALAPLFPNAAGATTTLTIAGGPGIVDSFDSTLGPLDIQNSFPTNSGNYSAILAAGSASDFLTIGNGTEVRGYLAWPSPPAGVGTSVTVKGQSSPPSPNVDPARVSRSPYIPQFDPLPRNGLLAAFSAGDFPKGMQIPVRVAGDPPTLNLGTAGGTTPARYYYDAPLNVQGVSTYYESININGPVILYVNGYLRIRGGGIIDIKSTGSLEVHYASNIRTYSGSHGILNRTKDPKKLVLIADSSAANASYLQNGNTADPLLNKDFYGIIYAPNTNALLGFDIQTGVNFYGAVSARKITFSAEANLHYDTSLRYAPISGVDTPYSITDWRELTDPAEKVILP